MSLLAQDISHFIDGRFHVRARDRTNDDGGDDLGELDVGIIFFERGDRNIDRVVA